MTHTEYALKLYARDEMHCIQRCLLLDQCVCTTASIPAELILTGKTVCSLSSLHVHLAIAEGVNQAVLHADLRSLDITWTRDKSSHIMPKGLPDSTAQSYVVVRKSLYVHIAQSMSHARNEVKRI